MNGIKNRIRYHKKRAISVVIVLAALFCAWLVADRIPGDKGERNEGEEASLDSGGATEGFLREDRDALAEGMDEETYAEAGTAQEADDSDTADDRGMESGRERPDGGTADHRSNPGDAPNSEPADAMPEKPSNHTDRENALHVHTWVYVSPEDSYHTEYGAECRKHGYNGEEPMFFRTQNDLFLHQAADGCTSSWGSGFKGLAYKYCSECGEEVITGHVHDFGTITKQVPFEKVVCECGMSFNADKDYSALDSWRTHVEIYTSHGYPREQHDDYQTTQGSVTRYEATKTCACGWRPVDNRPVY